MAPTRIGGDLEDHIRHIVGRDVVRRARGVRWGEGVRSSWGVEERIESGRARGRVARDEYGRILQREADAEHVVELLHETDLRDTQPGEARYVLPVGRQRDVLVADFEAGLLPGDHAPGLAEQEEEAVVLVVQIRVEVTHARREAVAFIVIRRTTGAAKVHLDVGLRVNPADVRTFDQTGDAALAFGLVKLGEIVVVRVGVGDRAVEVRGPVGRLVTVAIHHQQFDEAAERNFQGTGIEHRGGCFGRLRHGVRRLLRGARRRHGLRLHPVDFLLQLLNLLLEILNVRLGGGLGHCFRCEQHPKDRRNRSRHGDAGRPAARARHCMRQFDSARCHLRTPVPVEAVMRKCNSGTPCWPTEAGA